jgi:hypothetical protein
MRETGLNANDLFVTSTEPASTATSRSVSCQCSRPRAAAGPTQARVRNLFACLAGVRAADCSPPSTRSHPLRFGSGRRRQPQTPRNEAWPIAGCGQLRERVQATFLIYHRQSCSLDAFRCRDGNGSELPFWGGMRLCMIRRPYLL